LRIFFTSSYGLAASTHVEAGGHCYIISQRLARASLGVGQNPANRFFSFFSWYKDTAPAFTTLKAKVHADTQDLPLIPTAGVGFF
jgi:hypothetical protein